MAISLTHTTSAGGSDSADGKISKNAWNEAHTITMATGKLLGRQTASTGAVEELPLGWTLIATNTPSAVATSDLTSIPSTYSDLLIVYEGISHDSGSNQTMQIRISGDNGSSYTTAIAISGATAASSTMYGSTQINAYNLSAGYSMGTVNNLSADATATNTLGAFTWRMAGGIDAVRIQWSGGNFDAGTIKLYGKI